MAWSPIIICAMFFTVLPQAENLEQLEAMLPYNVSVEQLSITGVTEQE